MAEAVRRSVTAGRARQCDGGLPRLPHLGRTQSSIARRTRPAAPAKCRRWLAELPASKHRASSDGPAAPAKYCRWLAELPGAKRRASSDHTAARKRWHWMAGFWFAALVVGVVLSPDAADIARAAREVPAGTAAPAALAATAGPAVRASTVVRATDAAAAPAPAAVAASGAWRDALAAAFMGVVEGLTEFLPVSSTGHLILVGHFLHYGSPAFEIVIQLGAMFALTWCYRERLLLLAGGLLRDATARALAVRLAMAFLPAALAGFALGDFVESHLFRPEFVAAMLVAGGVVLLVSDSPDRRGRTHAIEDITLLQALVIGCGQTVALLPGVSRSGATIVSGLLAGLDRRVATEFSFLLALPTMYAAGGYTLLRAHDTLAAELGAGTLIGLVTAYVTALVVIRAFLRFVETNTLRPFGWYRIAAGIGIGAVFLFAS